ncbi:MAG: hypothetical protein AAF899_08475 [Pseudomonadota bacterium]
MTIGSASGAIAIIGWGSLIWDLDDLAPRVEGDWMIASGPTLPLEFSRVSLKRHGALTVVIDAEHGQACPTHVIRSRRASVLRAVVDLALRERASPTRIGYVVAGEEDLDAEARRLDADWMAGRPGAAQAADPAIAEAVRAWCIAGGWHGAVWTDLPGNFSEKTGDVFSVDRAERYLAGLDGLSSRSAVRYIAEAPAGTDTPLRRHLSAQTWWQTAVEGLDRGM